MSLCLSSGRGEAHSHQYGGREAANPGAVGPTVEKLMSTWPERVEWTRRMRPPAGELGVERIWHRGVQRLLVTGPEVVLVLGGTVFLGDDLVT